MKSLGHSPGVQGGFHFLKAFKVFNLISKNSKTLLNKTSKHEIPGALPRATNLSRSSRLKFSCIKFLDTKN